MMELGKCAALVTGGASGLGEMENTFLNGTTIRLDGAIRMPAK